ncbi:hypothetical protein BT96DRAFT_996294 [Gymnopus androsaceus JB14]|uniref:BTB domain-containing protein n=1 Tax=Gymnopus androsaceus JB14 TaxID=1447944 RepID=A0A6A4HGT6_9AGAR|nr:hypothetical protein BT96DRAFT_996294 [Gymnopus androsaceus JB14]
MTFTCISRFYPTQRDLSSAIFSKMLSPKSTRTVFPVAVVEEYSDLIRDLLLLCYPGKLPTFQTEDPQNGMMVTTFKHISTVLEAAQKYCLESEMFSGRAVDALLVSSPMEKEPHRIYALGVRFRWKEVCLEAAKRSVLNKQPSAYGDELKDISAWDLSMLQEYQRNAREVIHSFVEQVLDGFIWLDEDLPFDPHFDPQVFKAQGHSDNWEEDNIRCVQAPQWWLEFLKDVAYQYWKSPGSAAFTDPVLLHRALERATRQCYKCERDGVSITLRLSAWALEFEIAVKDWVECENVLHLNLSF